MSGSNVGKAVLLAGIAMTIGIIIGSSFPGLKSASAAIQPSSRTTAQNQYSVCYHTSLSDYWCPDSSAHFNSADYITRVEVMLSTKDGRRSVTIPGGVDAVFLTRDATEKFLLSYYWSTNREKAQGLTRALSVIK